MKNRKKEQLQSAGIDVDRTLERLAGNEILLKHFLQKFLTTPYYEKLITSIKEGDMTAALAASHALKGVSGNLSMIILYELLSSQVTALRLKDWEKAVGMMPKIIDAYVKITRAIEEAYEDASE